MGIGGYVNARWSCLSRSSVLVARVRLPEIALALFPEQGDMLGDICTGGEILVAAMRPR